MQRENDAPPPPSPVPSGRLYSIGHSNQELPQLVALLLKAEVTAVADVRSSPYSRRLPQFNREALELELKGNGIAYIFLGDLLGGRPCDRELYDADGRVDYERVRKTVAFRHGLERLLGGLDDHRIAMLCSEDDPLDCHRGLMISPAAKQQGVSSLHLRKDGSAETMEAMERRLLDETGGTARRDGPLFAALWTEEDDRAALAEAYRAMNRRKGFRLEME
ncbi:MAG TPA: DUF488 domain-containing protein [Gemmataceae bacterium]|nr:DUF488 domain-containing protein [Gemmataceae bacterium]